MAVAEADLHRVGTEGFDAGRTAVLLWRWARRDIRARYGRSALAGAWAVALPVAVIGTYCFIFGVIFDQTGGELPYLSFFLAGMVVFRPVTNALGQNTSLTDNYGVLGHLSFPREVLPLAAALGTSLELLVLAPALVLVAWAQGVGPHLTALLAVPILLVVLCLAAAVCVIASTVQAFVRDLQFVALFGAQALFFASPISYRPEQAPEAMQWLNHLNPIAVLAEALRDVVLRGVAPDWALVGPHAVLAVALLVGAVAHLRAVGHRIVDLA